MPVVFVSVYSPVKGRSVPACRSTWYSCSDNSARHSSSGLDDLRLLPGNGVPAATCSGSGR